MTRPGFNAEADCLETCYTNMDYQTISELVGLGNTTVLTIASRAAHAIAQHLLYKYVSIPS